MVVVAKVVALVYGFVPSGEMMSPGEKRGESSKNVILDQSTFVLPLPSSSWGIIGAEKGEAWVKWEFI